MNLRTTDGTPDIRSYERADLYADEGSDAFLREYFKETGHLEEYESGEFFMTEEMEDAIESLSPTEKKGWNSLPDSVKRRIMMQSLRKIASRYENDIFLNTEAQKEKDRLTEAEETKYNQTKKDILEKERIAEIEEEVEEEIAAEERERKEKEERQRYLRYQYAKLRKSKEFKEILHAEEALNEPGLSKEEKQKREQQLKKQYDALYESEIFRETNILKGESKSAPEKELSSEEKAASIRHLRLRLEQMEEEEDDDEEEQDDFLILMEDQKEEDESAGMFYSERMKKQLDSLHPEKTDQTDDSEEEDFPRSVGQFTSMNGRELTPEERRKRGIAYRMSATKKDGKKTSPSALQVLEKEGSSVPGMAGSEEIRSVENYASKAVFFASDAQTRSAFSEDKIRTEGSEAAALRKQRAAWNAATQKMEKERGEKLDGYVVLDRDNKVVWSSEHDENARRRDMDKAASKRQELARQEAAREIVENEQEIKETIEKEAISKTRTRLKEEEKQASSTYETSVKQERAKEKQKERAEEVAAQEAVLIRAIRTNKDTQSDKNMRMKEAIRLQEKAQKQKKALESTAREQKRRQESAAALTGAASATSAVKAGLGEAVREAQKTASTAQSGITLSGKASAAGRSSQGSAKNNDGFYSDMTSEGVSEIVSGSAGAAGFMKAAGADLLSLGVKRELSKELMGMGRKARKKAAQKATAQNEEMQKANQVAEKYLDTAAAATKKAAKTGGMLIQAGKGSVASVLPFPFKVALAIIGILVTILLLWLGFHLVDRGGEHAESTTTRTGMSSADIGYEVVEYAKTFIGVTKYVYGGNDFPNATDCSGFVQGVFKHFSVELNRDTVGMQQNGTLVGTNTLSGASPGDIIIFNPSGSGKNSHVGIYAGEGKMVDNSGSHGGPVFRDVYDTSNIQVRRVLAGASLKGIEIGNVSNNPESVYKAFRRAGFTPEGAAAALGNFLHESGLNGHSCEPWDSVSDAAEIKYTEMVNAGFGKTQTSSKWITEYQFIHCNPVPDGGRWTSSWGWGYGIAQWTDSGRRTNLYKTFKRLRTKYGKQVSIDSMLVQISCVIEESQTGGGNLSYAGKKMMDPSYKGESGVAALTYIWFDRFEWNSATDHADPDGSYASRYKNALDCYRKYAKLDPGTGDDVPLSSSSGSMGNTDLADLKKLLNLFGSSVAIDGLDEFVDNYIKNDSGFENTPGEGNTGGNNGKSKNPATKIDQDPVAKTCNYGYIKGNEKGTVKASKSGDNKGNTFKDTYGLDPSLSYFHPGWYYGKITKAGTYEAIDGGDNVTVSAGTTGIIMGHTNWGKYAYFRLANGRTISVKKGRYKVLSILYNSEKAYTNQQVEEWINRQDITGKTHSGYRINPVDRVLLVSKYNQRAWILTGSNHNWKCSSNKKLCGSACGTVAMWGNTSWSSPLPCYAYKNYLACNTKYAVCPIGRAMGMSKTRAYVSRGGGNMLHGGGHGHPQTHGCIAFHGAMHDAVYDLPVGTPLIVF